MLLGNYNVFNAAPGHAVGGPTDPTRWYKGGTVQNFYLGDHVISGETDKSSFPGGYNPPYSWILAPKAGGISSRNNTTFSVTATAAIAGGLPGSASATVTFSTTATGGLIVSGSGSAQIDFSSSGTLISVADGSGSATLTFSTSALIGALAGVSGSATITLSPDATSYAVGFMSGTSTNETEFSEAALARAVWSALKADYDEAGTMGEALNNAGSAGDPWSTALPGSYTAGTAGYILSKCLTVAKFLGLK